MTNTQYQRLLALALSFDVDGYRRGQSLFNALHQVDQPLADAIHGTDADPFFDDARIPDFWKAVLA